MSLVEAVVVAGLRHAHTDPIAGTVAERLARGA